MKIAIASTGPSLDDTVHDLFGRCAYFVIADTDSMCAEGVKNTQAEGESGVGAAGVQLVYDNGARAVISVKVGPKAFEALKAVDVPVYLIPPGITGGDALQRYLDGTLQKMEIQMY